MDPNKEHDYFKSIEQDGMRPVDMDPKKADWHIERYFEMASDINKIQQLLDQDPYAFGVRTDLIVVDYDMLVHDPWTQMEVLCQKLGLECSDSYLNATSSTVWPTYHYTRLDMQWSQHQICTVAKKSLKFRHLAPFMQVTATPMNPSKDSAYKCWGKCFPGNSPCPCAADYASK